MRAVLISSSRAQKSSWYSSVREVFRNRDALLNRGLPARQGADAAARELRALQEPWSSSPRAEMGASLEAISLSAALSAGRTKQNTDAALCHTLP